MKKTVIAIVSLLLIFTLSSQPKEKVKIKLATTTSTENSGLLDYLLPIFTQDTQIQVDVIAVGTGKALKLGENGDVDLVLVHARNLEDQFTANGFGIDRKDLMHNDFVILGPKKDPAKLKSAKNGTEAMKRIADKKIDFISRGDNSGTHEKEKALWMQGKISPTKPWYKEVGKGMEETIYMADQLQGYTLSDRGTYLSMKDKTSLVICYEGDPQLFNPYGVIAVNPQKWSHVKYPEVTMFIDWLTSEKGQNLIGSYQINGEVLFFPDVKK